MEIKITGLPYLIIGAFLYWLFWGMPTVMTAIPFVAMMFFWPIYLIFKMVFWAMIFGVVALVMLVLFLCYDHWKVTRARTQMMRKARGL